jgi:CheY-like chemotaxis protein
MKKVLVADDKATSRELIRTVLEQCGHTVFEASDGAKAVHAAREVLPDLSVVDLCMPVLDGFAVVQELRSGARRCCLHPSGNRRQMLPEPIPRQLCHAIQSAGLLEKVTGARNHIELAFGASRELGHGCVIEVQNDGIVAADNKQSRRHDAFQRFAGQIRPSSPRDYGLHFRPFCSGY